MKFSDLLKNSNNRKYAFILGMFYGVHKVEIEKQVISTYCMNKKGTRKDKHKLDYNSLIDDDYKALSDFLQDTDISDIFKDKGKIVITLDITENITKDRLYGMIEKQLIDFNDIANRYFVAGMMNARGSFDWHYNFMSIDLDINDIDYIRRRFFTLSKIAGNHNLNTRALQKKGSKKNDQYRMPLSYFMKNYGLLLPSKIIYYEKERNIKLDKEDFLYVDNVNKVDSSKASSYERALRINELALKFKENKITVDDVRIARRKVGLDDDSEDDVDALIYSNWSIKNQRKEYVDFTCEFDSSHITFKSQSNSKQYVEAHHIIPFSKRAEFDISIDHFANIVCLCPNCHRKIHLAVFEEKQKLLSKIYDNNINMLSSIGISITKDDLYKYYKNTP